MLNTKFKNNRFQNERVEFIDDDYNNINNNNNSNNENKKHEMAVSWIEGYVI